jgi:hypothetical protein
VLVRVRVCVCGWGGGDALEGEKYAESTGVNLIRAWRNLQREGALRGAPGWPLTAALWAAAATGRAVPLYRTFRSRPNRRTAWVKRMSRSASPPFLPAWQPPRPGSRPATSAAAAGAAPNGAANAPAAAAVALLAAPGVVAVTTAAGGGGGGRPAAAASTAANMAAAAAAPALPPISDGGRLWEPIAPGSRPPTGTLVAGAGSGMGGSAGSAEKSSGGISPLGASMVVGAVRVRRMATAPASSVGGQGHRDCEHERHKAWGRQLRFQAGASRL